MDDVRLVKVSKYLSKHLRHDPGGLDLTLAPGGWVPVADLLAALAARRFSLSRTELDEVVARNNKARFSFDPSGTLIRANQGHSVEVDLQLAPAQPPDVLYHGTGHQTADIIQREGLHKMRRHHVHLSADVETARAVGARHGRPVIFTVNTAAMTAAGHLFYRSDNGVWLTDTVPPEFLNTLREQRMDQTEAGEQTRYLANNKAHGRETHARWMEQLNRNDNDPGYKDEWGIQQCGGCRYFVPLTGVFIDDYGGCTNPASALDKHVMFEHDGCDAFAPASDGWYAGTYFESERLDVDEEGHLINPRTRERVELED